MHEFNCAHYLSCMVQNAWCSREAAVHITTNTHAPCSRLQPHVVVGTAVHCRMRMAATTGMALRMKGHLMTSCTAVASALEIRCALTEAGGQVATQCPAVLDTQPLCIRSIILRSDVNHASPLSLLPCGTFSGTSLVDMTLNHNVGCQVGPSWQL
jgi:hypothetical protein